MAGGKIERMYTADEVDALIAQSTARSTVQGLSGAASGVTLKGTLTYDPVAKTVRIYLSARSGSDISTSTVLANIPAAYRPSSTVAMVGYFTLSNNVSATYEALITTQGNVTQTLSSTVREVFIVGEYSIA